MAVDFPNSPSIGQTFTSDVRTWTWSGSVWNLTSYGSQGPQGAAGSQGSQGPQGAAPNVGSFFTIYGERNGSVATGAFFAFGNGATVSTGIRIEQTCVANTLSIAATTAFTGTFTAEIYKNGLSTGKTVSVTSGNATGGATGLNLSVTAGDRIAIYCSAGGVGGGVTAASVGFVSSSVAVVGTQGPQGNWSTAQTINAQTDNYTFTSADAGQLITINATVNKILTVGTGLALTSGQRIDIIRLGIGEVTFATSSTTVNATPGLKLRSVYSSASLICLSSNNYVLVGDLKA